MRYSIIAIPFVLAASVSAANSTVILSTAPVVPHSTGVPVAPYPVSNSTLVPVGTASAGTVPPPAPSASLGSTPVTTAPTTPAPTAPFKGAANQVAASSVSLVALLGLAAYFL